MMKPNAEVLEEVLVPELVTKFPAFCETCMFVVIATAACHLSVSSASLIQPMPFHPVSLRYILISSLHLCLDLPCSLFPTKTLHAFLHKFSNFV